MRPMSADVGDLTKSPVHRDLATLRLPGTIALRVRGGPAQPRTLIDLVVDGAPRVGDRVVGAVVAAGLDVHLRREVPVVALRDAAGRLLSTTDPVPGVANPTAQRTDADEIAETWLSVEADPVGDPTIIDQLRVAVRQALAEASEQTTAPPARPASLDRALVDLDEQRIADFLLRRLGGLGIDHTSGQEGLVPETVHLLWDEAFQRDLVTRVGGELGAALTERYRSVLPQGYRGSHTPAQAAEDIVRLATLDHDDHDHDGPGRMRALLYLDTSHGLPESRLRVYCLGEPIRLSDALSVLHSFGVRVTDERACVTLRTPRPAHIYDFGLESPGALPAPGAAGARLEDAFASAWRGDCEVDGLNELVVSAGLDWSQVVVLRAYTRYLRQLRTRFSPAGLERALTAHPELAARLSELFEARFDPDPALATVERKARVDEVTEAIELSLDHVDSLDQDEIIRCYRDLIAATTRTSAFQPAHRRDPASPLAIKLDPRAIGFLPEPRPRFEIYVYSPRFEAVHLRFGRVARGGLRWSDRAEDFRTEILGLVRAQTVKNAVIVPTGAKGGFVLRGTPNRSEAAACYQLFIGALLDLTDNLVDGVPTPPDQIVRYDDDDYYLVVAADKGTADFSDLANAIAADRGFWLGDAFASGGSAGYDHKAMGITARGAWESARHAFGELGRDLDTDGCLAVGIGDMSGDVFGNGMLLSRGLRLVAAFDHRSIFVDPDPDPGRAHAERRRLFDLPRSSWADYDRGLLGPDGGVWSRSAKAIRLTRRAREVLGVPADAPERLTPSSVIRHILTAPVDLLFNGGIGTYVKGTGEHDAEVGDRANDRIRVDGRQLRCQVVCEGGNLGLTQRGRVEYALAGGRVMTDFVDNSAGVDCSDHEVNIKILLDRAISAGRLGRGDRNDLLASMTPEVADLVLRHSRGQAMALGLARRLALRSLPTHRRMIAEYEVAGRIRRESEALPAEEDLDQRAERGQGLTTPELAVLLSHTKLLIRDALLDSSVPDEGWVTGTLRDYFPTPLRQRFADLMADHPLRREIVATRLANEVVDWGGTTLTHRVVEETGAEIADVVRAWAVVRDTFDLPALWRDLGPSGPVASPSARATALLRLRGLADQTIRQVVAWHSGPIGVPEEIARFRPAAEALLPDWGTWVGGRERRAVEADGTALGDLGLPTTTARRLAAIGYGSRVLDIAWVASRHGCRPTEVAAVHGAVVDTLQVDVLLDLVSRLPSADRWQLLAASALRSDLAEASVAVVSAILDAPDPSGSAGERVGRWALTRRAELARARAAIGQLGGDRPDLAGLSVVTRALRAL